MPRDRIPILASRAGQYAETPPIPALRRHFRCVWMTAAACDHSGPVVVVPDGCVDLLWREDRFTVVGPDVTSAMPDLKPGAVVLGLRFRPGAAARWLRLPLKEILGQERPMGEIWGKRAGRIAEELAATASTSDRLRVLQDRLAAEAANVEEPRPEAEAIFGFLKSSASGGGRRMIALRDKLGIGERTLRRQCEELFGYGPKTLDRILRFQLFYNLALVSPADGLAGLALRAGYADQAHLAREIRSLCGMTAGEFRRQLVA